MGWWKGSRLPGHLQGSAKPKGKGGSQAPGGHQAYWGALERPQAVESDLGSNPTWATSLHLSLRSPSPLGTTSSPPSGPLAHPAHQLLGQPHLSAFSFPPTPMSSHQLLLTHTYHLTKPPWSLATWRPYLLTSYHDPFPELQPEQTLEKAILVVSLSCPLGISSLFHQTYSAASAVHFPRPLHFSGPPRCHFTLSLLLFLDW